MCVTTLTAIREAGGHPNTKFFWASSQTNFDKFEDNMLKFDMLVLSGIPERLRVGFF